MKTFTYASAFSGIGGMTLGLKPLGGEGVLAWEYDPTEKRTQYAQEAHRLLHPEIPVHGDICEADTANMPDFDLLCFTPPCQAFSVAGKRGGFEDTRGTLTFEALRIARGKRPKALFMENVKGLMNHMSYADLDGVLTQQFIQGALLWEREENSVTIKSDIVKKNAENYLYTILQQNSDYLPDKSDTSSKSMQVIPIEKAESYLERGLIGKLKSLKTQILQTTKKLKDYPTEQIPQYVCNVDGLASSLEKLNLIDSLTLEDTSILDEMVNTLSEIVLSWKNTSEGNSERKKLFTTLTESNLTTELKTYISAVTELSTVVFILKRSNLLEKWLTKVSSRSIRNEESMFLISTFGVIVHAINEIGYTVDFTVLNSKFFDVAQNRERIYLVAIRNDLITPEPWNDVKGTTMLPKAKRRYQEEGAKTFNFAWPEQTEVRTRLRDFLEDSVDEKYYLSEDKTAALVKQLEEKAEGIAVKEATTKGYAVATEGDAVNIQFPNSKTRRGRVGKQMANTIEASGINQGVVERTDRIIEVGKIKPHRNSSLANSVHSTEGISSTLDTMQGGGREPKIAEQSEGPRYRIRKLTPTECLRLQSVPNWAIDTILANFSDSRAYKFAGNGLTTNVITAIGERLLPYLTEEKGGA